MKQIKLTQNKYALIDKEDFERLNQYKWFYNQGYATGYPKGKWNNKYFLMHRIILKLDNPKIFTDHIDRNGLNNTKSNLRIVNAQQNAWNNKIRKNSTSGYKGVSWHKRWKLWHVRIGFNHKRISLGYFKKLINAAKAYDKKAKELFGEFARINIK